MGEFHGYPRLSIKTLWLRPPHCPSGSRHGLGQSWSLLLLDPGLHRDGHEEQWQRAFCPEISAPLTCPVGDLWGLPASLLQGP